MAWEGESGVVRPRARGGLSVLCRGRIRGVGTGPPGSDAWSGRVETVLHIRPGPAGDGSAESCGNAPAFNTVETLPCAEQVLLHMGARPLETDVPGRTAESRGKPGIGPRGAPVQCATPLRPAREEPGRAHHRARRCRRGRDGCGAGPLVRRDVRFALERALLTAHFESKMHISTSAGLTRSHRPGRLPSAPPAPTPAHGSRPLARKAH